MIWKERDGARVHKRYDKAKTPYERILASPSIAEESKARLRGIFPNLDPVLLLQEMERLQNDLWDTAVGREQTEQIQDNVVSVKHEPEGKISEPCNVDETVYPAVPTRRRKKHERKKKQKSGKQMLPETTIGQELPAELKEVRNGKGEGAPSFAELLESFFSKHLMKHSPNTISSYRDTFRLLLQFIQRYLGKEPSQLELREIDAPLINAFLEDMEKERSISSRSRNLRLAAIRSFCGYAALEVPISVAQVQGVLAIPIKEYPRPVINFLTRSEVEALLAQPEQRTWRGRRDHALLLVAVETGLLVSEITGLQRQDIELGTEPHVRITGKGRKQRCTPLSNETAAALKAWTAEPARRDSKMLFPNAQGGCLSSSGVQYILGKHVAAASEACPSLKDKRVTPNLLRHTRALELLQAGMDRANIALWLGLESVESTKLYIHANLALKKSLTKRLLS